MAGEREKQLKATITERIGHLLDVAIGPDEELSPEVELAIELLQEAVDRAIGLDEETDRAA